jgi:hypothetical protein
VARAFYGIRDGRDSGFHIHDSALLDAARGHNAHANDINVTAGITLSYYGTDFCGADIQTDNYFLVRHAINNKTLPTYFSAIGRVKVASSNRFTPRTPAF